MLDEDLFKRAGQEMSQSTSKGEDSNMETAVKKC